MYMYVYTLYSLTRAYILTLACAHWTHVVFVLICCVYRHVCVHELPIHSCVCALCALVCIVCACV